MSRMQKNRIAKIKEEIQNDLKLARIEAEVRRKNERRRKDELGMSESLNTFHKPIIETLEAQDESRKDNLKHIQEAIGNISMPSFESTRIPELEYNAVQTINLNKDLDESFLREKGLQLPTELLNKSDKELDNIMTKISKHNKRIGSRKGPMVKEMTNERTSEERRSQLEGQVVGLDYEIMMMKKYRRALKILREGNYYMGEGLGLDVLEKLTDKICHGNTSNKVVNKIVVLLDLLLKRGQMTEEQVKTYYGKFLN